MNPAPAPAPATDLFQRQIHFVSGKGGVGKSAVACALALWFRRQGLRVLLAQVNAADSHAGLLGLPPVPDDVHQAEAGLFVVNTRPAQAMREYALMTLKFETLYRATFENRITRHFLRFIPSLAELTMLGKLWFHAEQRDEQGRPLYERVVVDTAATGHGLGFVGVSQVIRDLVPIGPMHEKAKEMANTFEDAQRSALHIVTLPEAMPVQETLELVAEVRRRRVVPLGAALVNALPEPLVPEALRTRLKAAKTPLAGGSSPAAGKEPGSAPDALIDVLTRRALREELAEGQLARLRSELSPLPLMTLPLLTAESFGRPQVEALADALAAGPGASA